MRTVCAVTVITSTRRRLAPALPLGHSGSGTASSVLGDMAAVPAPRCRGETPSLAATLVGVDPSVIAGDTNSDAGVRHRASG